VLGLDRVDDLIPPLAEVPLAESLPAIGL
jgi:hypothetical protein